MRTITSFISSFIFWLLLTGPALAQTVDLRCTFGFGQTFRDFGHLASFFANLAVGISFLIALLFAVFGGFRYITSGGDPRNLEGARTQITYALVGALISFTGFLFLILAENFFFGRGSLTTGSPIPPSFC